MLHYNMDITTILMTLLLMVTLELATHIITWTDVTTIYVRTYVYAPVIVTLELGQEECVRALVWESV